jgi:hypothetical protein
LKEKTTASSSTRSGRNVVSRAIGHASTAFTADQYAHDSDEAATEAAERVARAIE